MVLTYVTDFALKLPDREMYNQTFTIQVQNSLCSHIFIIKHSFTWDYIFLIFQAIKQSTKKYNKLQKNK